MRVLIAPDKFKGSLEAPEVAAHVSVGIEGVLDGVEVDRVPVADGGEGTVAAALAAGYAAHTATVSGPVGDPVEATFAVDGDVAVIEMAAASGLDVLPRRDGRPVLDALRADTHGTGELIAAALDAGCRTIVLGVGGSASTDGGAGLLIALGVRLLDADGRPVAPGGGGLARLETVDVTGLDERLGRTEMVLASDVSNPLLGPTGAATVFGPQKGAGPDDVRLLDESLTRLTQRLARVLGDEVHGWAKAEGAGAAGGVGFAALAVLGAERRPGIEVVLELVALDQRLEGVDVVITGEGSLDSQSLGGKTPLGVARRAREHHVPTVLAVCGRTLLSEAESRAAGFDRVFALADLEPDVTRSMRDAGPLLEQVGAEIGRYLQQSR
jgi:glycerate 2-kinase